MDKRRLEKIELDADLEQEARSRPAEPVVTDSNDEPAADASGDSDDEREDENEAVPSSDLFLDLLRQRGNEEFEITSWPTATVLRFEHEVLMIVTAKLAITGTTTASKPRTISTMPSMRKTSQWSCKDFTNAARRIGEGAD